MLLLNIKTNKGLKSMRKKSSGFSLMETVIAIMIMSVMAVFLASAMPHEYAVSNESQDLIKASDLAQKYTEEVKYQLKTLANYENAVEGTTPPVPVTSQMTAMGYFTVSTNVENVGRTDREDFLKEITVTYTKRGSTNPLSKISTIVVKPQYAY